MELFKVGFLSVRLVDLIDVSLAAFLLYRLYESLKGTLALRISGLIVAIIILWKVVGILEFRLLGEILDTFIGLGALALVVLFTPEIRKFLGGIAKNTLVDRLIRQVSTRSESEVVYREVVAALKEIRATGNGALIVLIGDNPMDDILETGDKLDADISSRLIYTIFQKESPMHDGAMMLKNNKIAAVRCILPLSQSSRLDPELGMRHRAGLGATESSDALVIIVSEERRELSLAFKGRLTRNVDYSDVDDAIKVHFQRVLK